MNRELRFRYTQEQISLNSESLESKEGFSMCSSTSRRPLKTQLTNLNNPLSNTASIPSSTAISSSTASIPSSTASSPPHSISTLSFFNSSDDHRPLNNLQIDSDFKSTTVLNPTQINKLKHDLSILTKTEGWKINPKNHLESWIEIPNKTDAEEVVKLLNEAGIGNAKLRRRRDNHVPLVKCFNINLSVLENKISSSNEPNSIDNDFGIANSFCAVM